MVAAIAADGSKTRTDVYSPKQARSKRTQAAILAAARALIAEAGVESLTIADLAARVGLTKGAFYARFRDKDALLDALLREMMQENRAELATFLKRLQGADASLAQIVRASVPVAVRLSSERAALVRLLALEHRGRERARRRILQVIEELVAPIRALFHERRHELSHPDPDVAAGMFVVLLYGLLDWGLLARESPTPIVPPSDTALAQEMTRALVGYLGLQEEPQE